MTNPTESDIIDKVNNLPLLPGVYRFKDSQGGILYVGKAKRLRNRVRSYFQDSANHDGRIKVMISKIKDLDVLVTDSEAEALILENNMIKEHHPRYNIMYRDDKSYPYICITSGDRPRVYPTRTVIKDGSRYYGPYDHVGHMKRMLETIRKTFGLCTCAVSPKNIDKTRGIPKWHSCFDDYLKNCSGDWEQDVYKETLEKVERLLSGKTEDLMRDIKEEMLIASDALHFEEAARLRDSVEALEKYNQKMKVVADKLVNRDVFAVKTDDELGEACGVLFKIREGKLIGKFHRFIKNIEGLNESDLIQAFAEDYYTGSKEFGSGVIPDEVYLSNDMEEPDPLMEYLWQEKGKKVQFFTPAIGEKRHLINMAISNAKLLLSERALEKQKAEGDRIPKAVKDLQEYLKLSRLPRRIECFDNSNIQGSDPVASMVSFVDGQPRKSEYKKYHIKTVTGPDDYASMREILKRRYGKLKQSKEQIPDLIIVDGGKGQLSAAVEALKEIDFYGQCDVVGLAKRLEEVFIPGKQDPVMIPKISPSLKLIQRARDEAHRFAITFHRKTRSKRTFRTELTSIEGIGEKTAKMLIKEFGSVKRVAEAEADQLRRVAGKKTGDKIYNHFHKV
jgi:excinuclease ABC subunit C